MDKKIMLAVAGAGKTYELCHSINKEQRNFLLAYTNENIKNIEKEVIDKFGEIPKETKILTFDSFLYRYFIRPYELLIFENFKIERFETKGVDIIHTPEPAYKNGGYNPKYKKKDNIEHYIINRKYYCSRIPELILDIKDLFNIAISNINNYCDYIYVDEVQDFRKEHYKVLEKIIKECNNILMVGDYWQHSVSGQNNSGIPFKDTTYQEYIDKLRKIDLKVDDTTLKKSRRCSKNICNFVRKKLNIDIEALDNSKEGNVSFISNHSEIKEILENDDIVKLLNKNSRIYSFHSINWSYSKGDTYKDICVILTDDYQELENENFILSKDTITNNQLYVALTRASRNVYILTKDKFYEQRDKYLKKY